MDTAGLRPKPRKGWLARPALGDNWTWTLGLPLPSLMGASLPQHYLGKQGVHSPPGVWGLGQAAQVPARLAPNESPKLDLMSLPRDHTSLTPSRLILGGIKPIS